MDVIRKKRYRDKINYIAMNIEDLGIIPKNSLEKKGIYYSLQTIIEATIDLVAMCVKDLGLEVKSDRENIEAIVTLKNLPSWMADDLRRANGLRNLLVHRYNGIDDDRVLKFIPRLKKLIFAWIEIIESVVNDEDTNN
ncbi:MAG: DUF86 domain-containing protein [Promethearchaeota archaeon]